MRQRSNKDWLDDLNSTGENCSRALQDLHAVILGSISYAFDETIVPKTINRNAAIDKIVSRTLLYVQQNLGQYDERSSFITWVLKIAVRQAFLEFRKQKWQANAPHSPFPEITSELREQLQGNPFLQYLHQIFKDELSENQRLALRSMVMFRMPKEEVARQLGMKFCDYFKMIHDARLRLKHRLEADGIFSEEDIENMQL